MTNTLNFIDLLWNADLIIKGVVSLLAILSVYSWSIIMEKYFKLKIINAKANKIIHKIEQEKNFNAINENSCNPLNQILQLINQDMNKNTQNNHQTYITILENEMDKMSNKLDKLATFASIAPFLGLFGTVWGIMNSFTSMSNASTTSHLNAVAPGIAEALFVTAIGFMVAIPCSFFFNYFNNYIEKIRIKWLDFILKIT